MRYILVLVVLLLPRAQAADGPFSAFGIADLSCGGYVKAITDNPQAASAYGWWVAGFVTGANLAKGRAISTDNAAHDAWLKQYCEKNPLESFAKAAIELNKELDKRKVP